jgi:hypothetical protein
MAVAVAAAVALALATTALGNPHGLSVGLVVV